MDDCGAVHAFDLHANKLGLIEKSAAALGLTWHPHGLPRRAHTRAGMGREGRPRDLRRALHLGVGVLASKPEIRYKDVTDISALTGSAGGHPVASARCLRPGGILVYSTCSLDGRENGDIVRAFLAADVRLHAGRRTANAALRAALRRVLCGEAHQNIIPENRMPARPWRRGGKRER